MFFSFFFFCSFVFFALLSSSLSPSFPSFFPFFLKNRFENLLHRSHDCKDIWDVISVPLSFLCSFVANQCKFRDLNCTYILTNSSVVQKCVTAWMGSLITVLEGGSGSVIRLSSHIEVLGKKSTSRLIQAVGWFQFLRLKYWSFLSQFFFLLSGRGFPQHLNATHVSCYLISSIS